MTDLFFPGHAEPLKRFVHQVGLGCCMVIGGYSLGAWLLRREHHLLVNLALSIAVGAVEANNVSHHHREGAAS